MGWMVFEEKCGPMEYVFGSIFLDSSGTRVVVVLMFAFGMISDVGREFLRRHFQSCTDLQFKEALVDEYICWNDRRIHWDIEFIRDVQDWEMELLTDFLNLINSTKIRREED
jgi:hypothetical protein